MDKLKNRYSRKSFRLITLFFLLMAAGISAGLFWGSNWVIENIWDGSGKTVLVDNTTGVVTYLLLLINKFYVWVVPAVSAALLLLGWTLWLILKGSLSADFQTVSHEAGEGGSGKKRKKDFVDQKIEQEKKRRLFLHSLSVLQRDGRLLDFFDEDLSLYEDEQIGAAVRSIQEDCKKTIKKYIDPRPVIDSEEDESVTVEPGFDIDSIKLVGNVSGEPPFEGVLKHRGWKAGKKEIPKLSAIQDAAIISPAEVEIQ